MTKTGDIEEFETLPDAEKREVLGHLLRISGDLDLPAISDAELLANADAIFAGHDEAEAAE